MSCGPHRGVGARRQAVSHGWELCAADPGEITGPEPLAALPAQRWISVPQPCLVAAALRSAGRWSLDAPARRFDAQDWWYRGHFELSAEDLSHPPLLVFDGLATVADVWLNGELLLHSTSMFVRHECDVRGRLRAGGNSLVLRFHALDSLLAAKRARPRWRAPMVAHQQLRWLRTTLLGRTPGWSPPAAAVGPLRGIWWERREPVLAGPARVQALLADDGVGTLSVHCSLAASALQGPSLRVELEMEREGEMHRAALAVDPASGDCSASLKLAAPTLWWPHTHGEPALYRVRLQVRRGDDPAPTVMDLGRVGFRRITLDTTPGRFGLQVNGVPVFCRGACWTPLDPVALTASPEATQAAVAQVRDAGMNMLRVGGTMVYEDQAFFDSCDELGVLVWQEFMFANMDYPEHDAAFMADVQAEAEQQCALWQGHASLAVLCGNSEVEQQAAMWGASRELWNPPLFHTTLREWAARWLPGVPYWPSSAHGGAFPHQANQGTTSYYGVGAYLRPADDARHAGLAFATECLAYANVPDEHTLARMPGGLGLRVHHPGWKERTPRDLNAGWDFEDVRDHYLAALFHVNPVQCRTLDHDRYLALSRVASGQCMADAYAQWRRPASRCGGALIWLLRDLWAGAGWGLLDDAGRPKACFSILKRALQPLAVFITDEGGNGLDVHLVNETAQAREGVLEVVCHGAGEAVVARYAVPVSLPARGAISLPLAQGLEGFLDLSYAYRFGPPPVTLVHASLRLGGQPDCDAFHFPAGLALAVREDLGLSASLHTEPASGETHLLVSSERFAQFVHLDVAGYVPQDNDFHLAPGASRRIALQPDGTASPKAGRGSAWALNAARPVSIAGAG